MEFRTTQMLSVLLLAFATASCIGAAPIWTGVLARLRRSVANESAGGDPASGASPTQSATEVLHRHYRMLHTRARNVNSLHRRLYSLYKKERFPNESNPVIRDMTLSFELPSIENLPQRTATSHGDRELVEMHYNNLITFHDILSRLMTKDTETPNITSCANDTLAELGVIIDTLEESMLILGMEASDLMAVASSPHALHADVTPQERNTRTLYVLQEFHAYLREVKRDYARLQRRHG